MTVEGPAAQPEGTVAPIDRLRAELAAVDDKATQARLLHECGILLEKAGEEPAAAKDFLAAFNADPQFREPLEALVRILTRRKSVKNLGKLLDALTRAADTAEERGRAFWEYAQYILEYEKDPGKARTQLEEAIGANPEDATPWLELEILAAADGDVANRMRALEARAELATDPTWKALLFIDLAQLHARAGEIPRAYELLDGAAALEGGARFRTRLVMETIAAQANDEDVLARALEGQADLVAEAIEDAERGDAIGVPIAMRTAAIAAEAWFRAADLRRRMGDPGAAQALLNAAAQRLPDSSVIARARLIALEASGDAESAAAVARQELERGASGPTAASLWLRIAEACALTNDRAGALEALRNALTADPACIPARALEIDLLGDGQEPAALAQSLEGCAESFTSEEAKGRAFLMAAFAWAVRADDVGAAKAALSQASMCGIPHGLVSRIARILAALRSDPAWYEEATKRLLAAGATEEEAPSLYFELGRSRLLRGDLAGATDAFERLAAVGAAEGETAGPSAWLGRVLAACAVGLATVEAPPEEAGEDGEHAESVAPKRSAEALDGLAMVDSDREMARGLSVVAAMRAARAGDPAGARDRLAKLHEEDASDEVTAVFLAELQRGAGDVAGASQTLATCAAAVDDSELAAALHLESAVLSWRAGERARAVEEIEAARGGAPQAASIMLSWALRGAGADSLDGRRRALEVALDAAGSSSGGEAAVFALERFGLEVAFGVDGGDSGEAHTALEAAQDAGTDDLEVAASLGRLLWAPATERREWMERALARLEEHGEDATALARAERYRLARVVEKDVQSALDTARNWVVAEPSLPAALEWMTSATAAGDREQEVAARRLVASHLPGEAKSAMQSSAAIVAMLDRPAEMHGLVDGEQPQGQLMNLELALPGCDPRRRSAAMHGLGDVLGTDAQIDAAALAGWSDLAAGNNEEAHDTFKRVVEARPEEIASWEGVRSAAEAMEDWLSAALASAQLGALCKNDERGAEFWEHAGLILLEKTEAHDDAEIAFDRAFERDPSRFVAFDKLFRRVRARNEDDRLLDIIAKRLDVAEDETEIAKMFWERARVLRKKGDRDGALAALENVTMLEPDHVGALALSGEICITTGAFAEAAPLLARLSTLDEAPKQQRLMSGVAAVDLYENKLDEPEKALEVLVGLHKAGLSTLPVRERLAKSAARNGAWEEAVQIFEQLMDERQETAGRIEAARLAMAIYRDKIVEPVRAEKATGHLLNEAPDDGEALDLVLTTGFDAGFRTKMLGRGKGHLVQQLAKEPFDADRVALLAKIAGAGQDSALRQATLGVLVALGREDQGLSQELAKLDSRVAARPQIALDARATAEIADPDDGGPVAELFALLAETVALALGPSVSSLGVGKRDRVDARGGHPLRLAVAEWMGAIGFEGDFDLYVGGPTPAGVHGVAGEQPALVLGPEISAPLNPAARSAIAREVFALRRGITSVRTRDPAAIASVAIAACNEVGIAMPNPGYAVYNEVHRGIHKEISRKVKKTITDVCQRFAQSGQDATEWAAAAQRSIDRMAVIAAGDVSLVLSDALNVPREALGDAVPNNERARRLLAFVLSPSYLELRKKLGMGVK